MSNHIFLGARTGTPEIITCEVATHALAIAGPRTGKGACHIIPTLRSSWTGNVICVDPKGEAVKEAATYREKMGQRVVAIDPVPDRDTGKYCSPAQYRTRFNPLDLVGRGGAGYRDLMMIADGLVISSGNHDDDFFEKTSRTLIAGALAFILEKAPPEHRHMGELRRILRSMNDPTKRDDLFERMVSCTGYGELAADAVSYMRREGGKSDSIYTTAAEHVSWLADEDVVDTLKATDFDLNELRTGNLSLFLVLPPDALETHGRFLRLFVRCALSVMKRGQVDSGVSDSRPCLFILDEFAKLGKIGTIAEDAGLMPGYGVHLFPILQGIGQLEHLYGEEGAEIFKGSASVISVFGLGNDDRTAQFASDMCGTYTDADISNEWDSLATSFERGEKIREAKTPEGFWENLIANEYQAEKVKRLGGEWRGADQDVLVRDYPLQARMDQLRSRVGKARFPSDKIRNMTARDPATKIAKAAFVFMNGDYEIITLSPYFEPYVPPPPTVTKEWPDGRVETFSIEEYEQHKADQKAADDRQTTMYGGILISVLIGAVMLFSLYAIF